MGLTKQYLRYVSSAVFGVIGSQKANIAFVTLRGGEKGRYVAVGACEHVFIWDVRKAEKVLILEGKKHEVTYLCPSPDGVHIAVGYEDGGVRIFNLLNGESNISFSGHKSAVSVIRYDALGARLVTGSRDTDVIVWDIINECGLYRLKGHKDAITQILFLESKNLLITSSKDSFVKWWDLDTQHCFKTMVGHRTEVWGMVMLNQERRLLTGSADSELRAWDIQYIEEGKEVGEPQEKKVRTLLENEEEDEEGLDEEPEERILSCKKAGSVLREARDRVVSLVTDAKAKVLACHGLDATLEVFTVLSEEEVQKKMDRKLKKAKKKAKLQEGEEHGPEPVVERKLSDEIQKLANIKASSKIRSMDCLAVPNGEMKLALLLQNNTVETYTLNTTEKNPTGTKTSRLTLSGHRTDVRTLAFSSDNIAILSASGETVKVWNRSTLQVIRTMGCEYALCSLFVPGDRQIILGTKSGKIQLFDLASGSLLETTDAHAGALWSMCLSPDQDSALIGTGSADRNVKIWGLDFGDCHRSMFAHDDSIVISLFGQVPPTYGVDIPPAPVSCISPDGHYLSSTVLSLLSFRSSVMFLQFVPKTHLFFTAGKDRKIKQWDADKFEHIQTLEGHHREVWCLAISPNGDHIVSSSHDKSLRLWERTRDPIILEEEKEMEREAEFEESLAKGDEPVVPGETKGEAEPAGKKTIETVKAAERIMEAVELYREESEKLEEHSAACKAAGKEPKAFKLIYFPSVMYRYVLWISLTLSSVFLFSELEVSLLVLPFPYVPDLLKLFNGYVQQGLEVELVCRCLFFLLRVHFGQITSNQMLLSVIDELRTNTISKVREIRVNRFEEKKRKRKKRERAVLTIT
uniref:WD repeat domain 3 n=1 Tax=Cyprinus carpio TaxID=7962 RepID=A0A8C1YMG2_CYPCA